MARNVCDPTQGHPFDLDWRLNKEVEIYAFDSNWTPSYCYSGSKRRKEEKEVVRLAAIKEKEERQRQEAKEKAVAAARLLAAKE